MLGKTNDTENAKSVISSDMKIKGKISADGDLVLLGSVVGDIKCHSLSVEDTGTLKGNVDADVVTVSGKCDGQVSGDIISIVKFSDIIICCLWLTFLLSLQLPLSRLPYKKLPPANDRNHLYRLHQTL